MSKEGNMTSQKEHNNTSILDCEHGKMNETPEKEFKILILRSPQNIKKHLHETRKSIYGMAEKAYKEITMVKKNQTE